MAIMSSTCNGMCHRSSKGDEERMLRGGGWVLCMCMCVCMSVSVYVCIPSVPKVILILCVVDCRRGAPQAAGGPFQILTGGR